MDWALVEQITAGLLRALERGDAATPEGTAFLVRRYVQTGRDDVGEALGMALAQGMQLADAECDAVAQAAWLQTLVEAAQVCDDDRVPLACAQLEARLQQQWADSAVVNDASVMLDSSLAYGAGAAAIDELERVIGLTYTPGGGVVHSHRSRGGAPGTLDDHVSLAGALLTAYSVAGRIPYGMLAEELVQFVFRSWSLDTGAGGRELFPVRCRLARVLLRLADLHRSDEYAQAAVLSGRDYARDAEQILSSLAQGHASDAPDAALYGIAVMEWLSLNQKK